jgi:hypothetical protein
MTEHTAGHRALPLIATPWALGALAVLAAALLLPLTLHLLSPAGTMFGDTLKAAAWTRWALMAAGAVMGAASVWPTLARFLTSRAFVFCIPLIALAAFASFKASAGVSNELYLKAVEEDGPVESLGALAEFFAAGLLIWAAWKTRGAPPTARLVMLLIGLASLFLGLEEINYGQRILGFDTPPDLKAINYQESFNLHNRNDLVWFADEFTPDMIGYWGLGSWLVAMVIGRIKAAPHWFARTAQIALPALYVASWFLPYIIWTYVDVRAGLTISEDQEPAEAFLGFAFLAYALSVVVATAGERRKAEG